MSEKIRQDKNRLANDVQGFVWLGHNALVSSDSTLLATVDYALLVP